MDRMSGSELTVALVLAVVLVVVVLVGLAAVVLGLLRPDRTNRRG